MNDFYKIYDIVAEVKTPIFVGSGDKLSKKDYYVDEKENRIYVVDVNKLIRRSPKILSLYEEYANDTKKTFNEWIRESSVRSYLSEEFVKNELVIYTVDKGNVDIRGGVKQNNTKRQENRTGNIEKFVKNVYNEVYLPGSSIKGAIRTAILSSELLNEKSNNNEHNINQLKGVVEGFKDRSIKRFNSKNIEKQYFNKLERNVDKRFEAVNDIFSYISISDSEPIGINSLVLCEKIDIDKDGKEHKLNLIRETLKPKTEIRFRVNIQNNKNVYQIEDILERLKSYSKYYLQYYNKNFKLSLNNYDGIHLPIGGGVGYISKTTVDKIAKGSDGAYYISQILGNIFKNHKHFNDYKDPGFAPRLEKSTRYDNQLVPMGLLEVKKIFEPKTGKSILNI